MARRKATPRKASSRAARAALGAGLIVPVMLGTAVQAVVLGPVHVRSHLGQPLVAEVDLLDVDQDSLKAGLASAAVHRNHGYQIPSELGNVNVKVQRKSDGRRVLRLTSERPVREPVVELLLEAEDRTGGLVRYVPLLLDPPTGEPKATSVGASDPLSDRPVATATPLMPGAEPPLRAGRGKAVRGTPSADAAMVVGAGAAVPQTGKRSRRKPTPAPAATTASLPLPTANPGTGVTEMSAAPVGGVAEPAAPRASPPVTEVKPDAAVAGNVPGVSPSPGEGAHQTGGGAVDAAVAAAAITGGAPADVVPEPGATATAPTQSPELSTGTPSMQRAPVAPPPKPSQAVAGGELTQYFLAGSGFVLIAGLGALAWHRRRRRDAHSLDALESDGRLQPTDFVPGEHPERAEPALRSMTGGRRGGKWSVMRNTSVFRTSALDMDDEVDPVAEADVYIAYGRLDQAQVILDDALRAHPDRAALYVKLLSIHLERRDAPAFENVARALAHVTGSQGSEWTEAVAMGQQIDPENSLYTVLYRPRQAGEAGHSAAPGMVAADSFPATWQEANHTSAQSQEAARSLREQISRGSIDFSVSTGASALASVTGAGTLAASRPAAAPESPLPKAGSAVSARAPGDGVIDFELVDIEGAKARVSTPAAGVGAVGGTTQPEQDSRHEARCPPLPMTDGFDSSQFDTLPGSLEKVGQLARSGDRARALAAAHDAAILIAQLRREVLRIVTATEVRAA